MPAIRTAVTGMTPYVPGKPVEDVQRELGLSGLVKLNQNENPLGPSPRAMEAVTSALAQGHTYGEQSGRVLREKLGGLWDLPDDWFVIGNGSGEILRLIAESYLESGDRVVVPSPSFSSYSGVARLMGAEVLSVPLAGWTLDLAAMTQAALSSSAKIVFLCRPNNPTGTIFPEAELIDMLSRLSSDTLVVVDQAYREFETNPLDSRRLLGQFPNVILARTYSKLYGLAGLRLGYGVMRPEVAAPLRTVRDPFSVNNLAVVAGVAALNDRDHVERTLELVSGGREALYACFQKLGLSYITSDANFVLVDVARTARPVHDALLAQGILVRDCASFGLPCHLRVSVGTLEEIARFSQTLTSTLADTSR